MAVRVPQVLVVTFLTTVVACHRTDSSQPLATSATSSPQPPSSAASTIAPPSASASAAAPGAPDDSPDGAPEWGETHKPNCGPALLGQLQAAISHLYDNPPGTQIEKVEHPVAHAYTALLRWAGGDEAGSNRALHLIPYNVADVARGRPDSHEPRIRELLRFVFEAEYRYVGYACRMPGGTGAETWCGIFDKYPDEALAAFGQEGGSIVDDYSDDQKRHCAVRLIRDHGSPALAREFDGAFSKLVPAIYDVAARPLGTGYSSLVSRIDDLVEEPIFRAAQGEHPDPKDLDHDIEDAGRYIRDLDERLARFRRQEEHIAPALASGYCKIAEHRNQSLDAEHCRADANARLERALQMWLEARPYASLHIDPKGEVYDPKPWR